jgi:glycosyltransferase involved in cell wall biosynthesis
MRILIVSHYFPPEIGAPQRRLSDLARMWAAAGNEVTVLTGMPNHPIGIVPAQYRNKKRVEEVVDGYKVVRTWLYATPNEGVVRKTIGHISFMLTSLLLGARRTGAQDVVIVSSPTFFSIFSAWVLAKLKRSRFVVEVRDLWPAIFVELGILTNRMVIRALERLEMAAYRAADAVVVVSEGFKANIAARGIAEGKIHVIPNGVDLTRFSRRLPNQEIRARLGATEGEAVVLYIGAHGLSHGLESVAECAARVQDDPIHFAFVGEGAAKRKLLERVTQLHLTNVTTLPGVPSEEVPDIVAAADICLVPLRDVPLFATFIPSKMFEFMAAEKPIIGSVRGEPAEILQAAGALVVEPEDPVALAHAIQKLANDPGLRHQIGEAGKQFVADKYDRERLASRYLDIVNSVIETRP